MENEQKKIELANLMTYDQFVAIELLNLQDTFIACGVDFLKKI